MPGPAFGPGVLFGGVVWGVLSFNRFGYCVFVCMLSVLLQVESLCCPKALVFWLVLCTVLFGVRVFANRAQDMLRSCKPKNVPQKQHVLVL